MTGKPGDALPTGDDAARVARLLGYVHRPQAELRDDYRRVTRRARRGRRAGVLRPRVSPLQAAFAAAFSPVHLSHDGIASTLSLDAPAVPRSVTPSHCSLSRWRRAIR